jgi:hypothetical protein
MLESYKGETDEKGVLKIKNKKYNRRVRFVARRDIEN